MSRPDAWTTRLALLTAQVLVSMGTGLTLSVAVITMSGLTGSDGIAGMAQTFLIIGTLVGSSLIGGLSHQLGGRVALSAGCSLAILGGILALFGLIIGAAPVALCGFGLMGFASSVGLANRFMAANMASSERKAQAVGSIMGATAAGSIVGPNLASTAAACATSFGAPPMAGPLVTVTALWLAALAVFLAAGAAFPRPVRAWPRRMPKPSTWPTVIRRAGAWPTLARLTVLHGVMVSLMAMTPLHLSHTGVSLRATTFIMSAHLAAMYLPGPTVARLLPRLGGALAPTWAFLLLLLACGLLWVGSGASAADTAASVAGLVVLGLGWSLGMVACSADLSGRGELADRALLQGLGDVLLSLGGIVFSICGSVVMAGHGLRGTASVMASLCVAGAAFSAVIGRRPASGSRPSF